MPVRHTRVYCCTSTRGAAAALQPVLCGVAEKVTRVRERTASQFPHFVHDRKKASLNSNYSNDSISEAPRSRSSSSAQRAPRPTNQQRTQQITSWQGHGFTQLGVCMSTWLLPCPSLLLVRCLAHLFRRALLGVVDDEKVLARDLAEGRHRDLHLRQHTRVALCFTRASSLRLVSPASGGKRLAYPAVGACRSSSSSRWGCKSRRCAGGPRGHATRRCRCRRGDGQGD